MGVGKGTKVSVIKRPCYVRNRTGSVVHVANCPHRGKKFVPWNWADREFADELALCRWLQSSKPNEGRSIGVRACERCLRTPTLIVATSTIRAALAEWEPEWERSDDA